MSFLYKKNKEDKKMKIYCIENKLDGKKYVGLTKGTIQRRFKRHKELAKSNREKQHLHDALLLYGFNNFIVYELDTAISFEELCEKEKHWIKIDGTHYKTLTDVSVPKNIFN